MRTVAHKGQPRPSAGPAAKRQRESRRDSDNTIKPHHHHTAYYVTIGVMLLAVVVLVVVSNVVQTRDLAIATSSTGWSALAATNEPPVEKQPATTAPVKTIASNNNNNENKNDEDDFELARTQSFGFFQDITSKHWKELQKIHAESFPNHYTQTLGPYSNKPEDKRDYSKLAKSSWWNGENFQIEFHCPFTRRVPPTSQADGPKFVCDPHRLAENAQRQPKPCLIYSFGSNGKAEFEAGMRDIVGDACEIHTFDMADSNNRFKNFTKELEGVSTFHKWGLGTSEQAKNSPRRFKTLRGTMDALGHTGRTIDVFKIDCEWCEWYTHDEWFDDDADGNPQIDIRQILVETHNAPLPNAIEFFYGLHDRGYVIFNKEANFQNGGGGQEITFLKLSREFFENQEENIHRSTHRHSRKRFETTELHSKSHYFYGDVKSAKAISAT